MRSSFMAELWCLVPAKKRSFRASLIRHCHPEHTIRTVTLNLFQSLFFISYYRLSIVDNISNINILHMRFRNKFGMISMRSFFWLPPAERSAFDRIGLIAVQTVPCGLRCALCSGRSECASLSKNICFFVFISLQSFSQVRDSLWCLKNILVTNPPMVECLI